MGQDIKCEIIGFIPPIKIIKLYQKEIRNLLSSNWLDAQTRAQFENRYRYIRLDLASLESFWESLNQEVLRIKENYHA